MEAKVEILHSITGPQLDAFLEMGWYRMQQRMFTAHVYEFNNQVFPLFWARVNLNNYQERPKPKVLKRNRDLKIVFQEAFIDPELEALFALYSENIDFDHSPSIRSYLLGETNINIFPTRLLTLFSGDTLIGACYFDEGQTSLAGILNFFHPAYRTRSLGLLMMYLVIEYAVQNKYHFFYPGYIAPGYPKFDYKLAPGPDVVEIREPISGCWVKHSQVNYQHHHLLQATNKLMQTQALFLHHGIHSSLWFNAHYHSLIWHANPDPTMDQPLFLVLHQKQHDHDFWELATFDLFTKTYWYNQVTGDIWRYEMTNTNGCICRLKLLDQKGPFLNSLDMLPFLSKEKPG